MVIPSPILESHTPSTLIVSMSFPNRNEASRKRKRRSSDRLYKTIPKLEKDKVSLKKSNAILRKRVHQMKKRKQADHLNTVLTPQMHLFVTCCIKTVSTARSGKRDVKSIHKGTRLQKRVLNNNLSNLFQKSIAEKPHVKVYFSTFTEMRLVNYILAYFANH